VGCKSNLECEQLGQAGADGGADPGDGGVAVAKPLCDTTRHQCVECVQPSDCAVGRLCSQAGNCVDGCDLSKGKGCVSGLTCCRSTI
jgi:hypothetical protein